MQHSNLPKADQIWSPYLLELRLESALVLSSNSYVVDFWDYLISIQKTYQGQTIHATAPKIYIVGRSKSKAESMLAELTELNPDAKLSFIESEISLIRNVDVVCEEIRLKENCLDLLFMTPGWLSLGGRNGKLQSFALSVEIQKCPDWSNSIYWFKSFQIASRVLTFLSEYPTNITALNGNILWHAWLLTATILGLSGTILALDLYTIYSLCSIEVCGQRSDFP